MDAGFELPRRQLERLNQGAENQSREAVERFVAFIKDYDLDEMDQEARECLRDKTIDEVLNLIDDYGDASATEGLVFYETVLGMMDDNGEAGMPADFDRKRVDKAVRRCATNLFGDDADLGKFTDGVSDFLERIVSHRADECVAENAVAANESEARKGKKRRMKFARVPMGPSCGFCIMLASRGFVYATKKAAGELTRFHNNCDCRIVEGYDGMRVEGYDPDGLYKRYKSCRDTLRVDENPSPIRRDWERLPADEKAKYYKPGDPKRNPSYEQYIEQRIADEMDTRDRQWLYDGTVPKVDTSAVDISRMNEQQRKAFEKEYGCATTLADNGFAVRMIDDPNAKPLPGIPKIDYEIGEKGEQWEAKCPEGDGYLAVAGNIAKADAKFRKIGEGSRIVLSNLDSQMSDEQFKAYFYESLSDSETDYSNVIEIIFVYKDGSVERWAG